MKNRINQVEIPAEGRKWQRQEVSKDEFDKYLREWRREGNVYYDFDSINLWREDPTNPNTVIQIVYFRPFENIDGVEIDAIGKDQGRLCFFPKIAPPAEPTDTGDEVETGLIILMMIFGVLIGTLTGFFLALEFDCPPLIFFGVIVGVIAGFLLAIA